MPFPTRFAKIGNLAYRRLGRRKTDQPLLCRISNEARLSGVISERLLRWIAGNRTHFVMTPGAGSNAPRSVAKAGEEAVGRPLPTSIGMIG